MEFDLDERGHVSSIPLLYFKVANVLEIKSILKLSFFQKEAQKIGSIQVSLTADQCRLLGQQLLTQADILEQL